MKQLDPKAVWLFFISFALPRIIPVLTILLIFSVVVFLEEATSVWFGYRVLLFFAALIIFISVLISYIWARLTYYYYRYELTENGFKKEHGVIWKKYVTIPYERIQNVDIYRGVWARILGLSDLHIQTAGMSGPVTQSGSWGGQWGGYGAFAEGRLPGLSKKEAEDVRDELIKRAQASKNQGL